MEIGERTMKRIMLVTALLIGGAVSASADTDVWSAKPPRGDADRVAANQYCDETVGPSVNHVPTSATYKRCMASRGWRFVTTKHDDTWINHHGLSCHSILNGFGSVCSNF
jgi:hypothetical protein